MPLKLHMSCSRSSLINIYAQSKCIYIYRELIAPGQYTRGLNPVYFPPHIREFIFNNAPRAARIRILSARARARAVKGFTGANLCIYRYAPKARYRERGGL